MVPFTPTTFRIDVDPSGSPAGRGRVAAASTDGLKLGGMQMMLTSVASWRRPSVRLPAGVPCSVTVLAPPPAGPKAPWLFCSQLSKGCAHVLVAGAPGVV